MSCVRNAMSGICRLALALALCGAFAAARGDSMKVSVWRGESASFFVSDEYPEAGGRDAELDALAAKFDLKKLLDGTDYEGLRRAVLDVVNR